MRFKSEYVGDGVSLLEVYCLSSETKPTENIAMGSTAVEVDTGKVYFFNEAAGSWVEQSNGGGSGGGGVLIVHDNNGTLDKTWQEIHDAGFSVCFGDESYTICVGISSEDGEYIVNYWSYGYHEPDYYVTNSASGYPVRDQG